MAIDITMPALSPTMESGTLAKWHIKVGDVVKAGDVIAEIETDKATMEVEAVDEGTVTEILVEAGTEDVLVNAVIARIAGEDEDATPAPKAAPVAASVAAPAAPQAAPAAAASAAPAAAPVPVVDGNRIKASPLARRVAQLQGVDLTKVVGSGPHGRIVRKDVEAAAGQSAAVVAPAPAAKASAPAAAPVALAASDVPHEDIKLSNMRKTIARRLTESKQQVPHFYLTVDVQLDALLKLRSDLNKSLESRGVKLSVNDLLIKAQALALLQVPDANVSFGGDVLRKFSRADISVAVAIPGGLITPVIRDAGSKSPSAIATEMKDLAARAKDGKLQPSEYTGGTASISNLGMFGIKQFDAVINPPEAMILAVGAGEQRPYIVNGELGVATVMTATGSFDHRAIDGAVGAQFMSAFKQLVENPLSMLA